MSKNPKELNNYEELRAQWLKEEAARHSPYNTQSAILQKMKQYYAVSANDLFQSNPFLASIPKDSKKPNK